MAKKDADEAFEEARELIVAEGRAIEREGDAGVTDYVLRGNYSGRDSDVDAYKAIIDRIMSSTSIEEILNPAQPSNLKEFSGQEIIVQGFRMIESDYEKGANFYVAMDVMDPETSEEMVITTGQQGIMAQLMAVHNLQAFPISVVVTPGRKPNRHGTYMYRLIGKSLTRG